MEKQIKNIVLTGASGGMGQEVLKKLLINKEYNIFVTYRSEEQLVKFKKYHSNKIDLFKADLTSSDDLNAFSEHVNKLSVNNGLYALINCAGLADATPLEYAKVSKARDLMEVNYFAPMILTKNLLPSLKTFKEKNIQNPRILNVASWAGVVAQPFIPFYNASKFAILGFSESIYYDLGLEDIHVVSVIPGITKTPLLSKTTNSAFDAISDATEDDKIKYKKNFSMFSADPSEGSFSRFLATSEQAANKIVRVVECKKPKVRYTLSLDAKMMDSFVSRFLTVGMRLSMMKLMYKLEK